jgi:RIO kinase 1
MTSEVEDDFWEPTAVSVPVASRRFGGYDEDVVSGQVDEALEDDESLEDRKLRYTLEKRKTGKRRVQEVSVLSEMGESIVAKDREMRMVEKKEGDYVRATLGSDSALKHFQPQTQRLVNKVNLGNVVFNATGVDLSQAAAGSIKEQVRKAGGAAKANSKDRADRATVEQVLDPRTRLILFKLINNGFFNEINGCISTGKEANVYHAVRNIPLPSDAANASQSTDASTGNESISQTIGNAGGVMEMAVKIFKTSILVFKDRDQYVTGEFRFRRGYSRHNPRKMVRVWAEKEMRNLIRMNQAGIPCPQALQLRSHVLIMSFIGKQGWAAPRLKDAVLTPEQYRDAYGQVIKHMRTLFHKCRLVHADLSEYNILYYKNTCYIIDVGQAVEHDHPSALEFLRRDADHINQYFSKNAVLTMTTRDLFDFIIDATLLDSQIEDYLERAQDIASQRQTAPKSAQDEVEETVFQHSFIPRTMEEVAGEDYLLDRYKALATGDITSVYYRKVLGLNPLLSGADKKPDLLKTEEDLEKETLDPELNARNAAEMKAAIESYYQQLRDGVFEGDFEEEEVDEWDEDEEDDEWDDEEDYEDDDDYDEEEEGKDGNGPQGGASDDEKLPALIPASKASSATKKAISDEEEDEEDDEDDEEDDEPAPKAVVAKMVGFRLPGRPVASSLPGLPKASGQAAPKSTKSVAFVDEDDDDEDFDEEGEEDDKYDEDGEEDDDDDDDGSQDDLSDEEADEDAVDGSESDDQSDKPSREPGIPRARRSELTKEEKKAHKAQVRKEKAEKRKTKTPKHVKKRARKLANRKK